MWDTLENIFNAADDRQAYKLERNLITLDPTEFNKRELSISKI